MADKFRDGMEELMDDVEQGVPDASAVFPGSKVMPPNRSGLMRVLENNDIQASGFHLSVRGLELDREVSESEWMKFGATLFRFQDYLSLFIGDWLVVGEHKWGKTYQSIAKNFRRKEKTLRNYRWVCGSVEMSVRKDNLTFGHYQIVASYDRNLQSDYLAWASNNNASVGQLREYVAGKSGKRPVDKAEKQVNDYTRAILKSKDDVPYMQAEDRERFVEQTRYLAEYYTNLWRWASGNEE